MYGLALVQVLAALPAGFEALREAARHEGYRHLDRLANDWASGAIRFDRPGEALLAARIDDALAGIGGMTLEPDLPGALRMRRFHVDPAHRRRGIATALAQALLDRATANGAPVTVNAPGEAARPFWEHLGFRPVTGARYTHILTRPAL